MARSPLLLPLALLLPLLSVSAAPAGNGGGGPELEPVKVEILEDSDPIGSSVEVYVDVPGEYSVAAFVYMTDGADPILDVIVSLTDGADPIPKVQLVLDAGITEGPDPIPQLTADVHLTKGGLVIVVGSITDDPSPIG